MTGGRPSKFCVLTTGRTGSTALMDALEKFDDIALPNKNIACPDNELVHPKDIARYAQEYSGLCQTPITRRGQLIDCFYEYNADSRFAGFKSMPERHRDYRAFIDRKDITFITLIRCDVASTVSSFMLAFTKGTWRRSGEAAPAQWTFRREDAKKVLDNLAYIHHSLIQLGRVPGAIRLTYEDLCDADFQNAELDGYFERPIRIDNPRPPTSGRDYVTNWEEFEAFVVNAYRRLQEKAGRPGPGFSGDAPGPQ